MDNVSRGGGGKGSPDKGGFPSSSRQTTIRVELVVCSANARFLATMNTHP